MTLAVCLRSLTFCRKDLEPIWWLWLYYMIYKCLLVFLSTEETPNPGQIPNYRRGASNLQGTSTLPHCCMQTLIIVLLSSASANKQPSAAAKYLKFGLISAEHLLPFVCTPVLVFSLGLVFMSEIWLFVLQSLQWRPLLARLLWTVDGCTWDSEALSVLICWHRWTSSDSKESFLGQLLF